MPDGPPPIFGAPKYDVLQQYLDTLRSNQQILRDGIKEIEALERETVTQVETVEAQTVAVKHSSGFADEDTLAWDNKLSEADYVDVSGLRNRCDVLKTRMDEMNRMQTQVTEAVQNRQTANESADTAIGDQETAAAAVETERAAAFASLQQLAPPTTALHAQLDTLRAQAKGVAEEKERIRASVWPDRRSDRELEDSKYDKLRENWDYAKEDEKDRKQSLVDDLRKELDKRQHVLRDEVEHLTQYGSNAVIAALVGRQQRALRLGCFAAWRECLAEAQLASQAVAKEEAEQPPASPPPAQAPYEDWLDATVVTYLARFPSVEAHLREDIGWPQRMQRLEARLKALSLCPKTEVDRELSERVQAVADLAAKLGAEGEDRLTKREAHLRSIESVLQSVREGETARSRSTVELDAICSELAREASHKTTIASVKMVTEDVMLLWESIKRLEINKADRGELKALRDLEDELAEQETARLNEFVANGREILAVSVDKLVVAYREEIAPHIADHTDKFIALQEMLKKLSVFVEEMVAKLTELSYQAKQRLGPAKMVRTGGGFKSLDDRSSRRVPPMKPPRLGEAASAASLEEGCARYIQFANNMLQGQG